MAHKLYNIKDKEVLKQELMESNEERITLSFYRYARIGNVNVFRDHMYTHWEELGVYGRTYVANEGINAQISVPKERWDEFTQMLSTITFLERVRLNIAIEDDGKSFYKLIIRIKEKIVADGLDDKNFDVLNSGVHLKAEDFNELTDDPETIIVDMRNHYESEVGHFENALCPDVDTFRDALPLVEKELEDQKDKNIVMYCTGGIRCEKASAYYKHKGFKNVFQLDGGIIEYAREVKKKGLKNKFIGKNFVFDERLGERISEQVISKCYQCGKPSDVHHNCENLACHRLVIQCDECREKYDGCCTDVCQQFMALPVEKQIELRKSIQIPAKQYHKTRTSPFLEDETLQEKVKQLYLDMNG